MYIYIYACLPTYACSVLCSRTWSYIIPTVSLFMFVYFCMSTYLTGHVFPALQAACALPTGPSMLSLDDRISTTV